MEREELMQTAQMLERRHQELEENLKIFETQISELENFRSDLEFLEKSKEKESISALGKGVFIKSTIDTKKELFIEVGAGVIVKKTPDEARQIISSQLKRLKEVRLQIISEMESHQIKLQNLLGSVS